MENADSRPVTDTRSLLVVDDQEDIREIIKAHFEPKGFRVYTAADGGEGFEIIEASKPDCVLLDVKIQLGIIRFFS